MRLGLGQLFSKIGRIFKLFLPSSISGLELWLDATDETTLNSKLSADFVSANSGYLSSSSTDFDKGNESFSLGCWVYFDNITNLDCIFSKYQPSQFSYLFYKGNDDNLYVIMSSTGSGGTTFNSGFSVTNNTWYFVVFVHDADNDLIKISVNGADFLTTSHTTGAYSSSTADFMIGQYSSTGYLDGQIDGAFFFDRVLELDDVKAMYNAGNGVSYNALINELNGSQYALGASFDLANSEFLSSTSTDFDKGNESFSFGGWIYIDSSIAGTETKYLCNKWKTTNNNRSYALVYDNTSQIFSLLISTLGTSTSILQLSWGSTSALDTWHFIVGLYDSTNDLMKLSVNGGDFVATINTSGVYNSTADFD
jgi:hypothetical protein